MRSLTCAFMITLVLATRTSGRCADSIYAEPVPSASEGQAAPAIPFVSAASAACVPSGCASVAQTPMGCGSSTSPFDGAIGQRSLLLGSVFGVRDALADNGITINADTYQFYQGVASGGIQNNFQYSGRNDYFMNINGEKAGLWKGFFVDLHGETRYGDTVNSTTGAIMPVNTAELFPAPTGTPTALTAVKFTQALSENFITFAGKLNMIDGFSMPFTGARVLDGFWNLGMAFPVIAARTIPYSTLGAGAVVLQEGAPVFTLLVLDTNNTPTTSGFQSFFNNGATIFANAKLPTKFFDLPGHQGVSGTYSTGTYNSLQPTAYFDPNAGLVVSSGTSQGSWCFFYSADQAFWVDPKNPKRAYGVFTNIGVADNGPSPIRFSANVALYGCSPIASRPLDTFGVGYTFTQYSSPIQNVAPLLLPIGDDQAVEMFYNYAVTKWFNVAPDLQVVVPARDTTLPPNRQSIDTSLVLGIRAKIDF